MKSKLLQCHGGGSTNHTTGKDIHCALGEQQKHRLGSMFVTFILVLGYVQLTIRSTTYSQGDSKYRIPEKNNKKQGTVDAC